MSTPTVSPESIVANYLIPLDSVYGLRGEIAHVRRTWASSPYAQSMTRMVYRDNYLKSMARRILLDAPHDPVQAVAVHALLESIDWTKLADLLLAHFTPERIEELDAIARDLIEEELEAYAHTAGGSAEDEPLPPAAIFSGMRSSRRVNAFA